MDTLFSVSIDIDGVYRLCFDVFLKDKQNSVPKFVFVLKTENFDIIIELAHILGNTLLHLLIDNLVGHRSNTCSANLLVLLLHN